MGGGEPCLLFSGHDGGCLSKEDPPGGFYVEPALCCEYAGWGREADALMQIACPVQCRCHADDCHPRTNMKRPYLPPIEGEKMDQGFTLGCFTAFPGMTNEGVRRHWEMLSQLPMGWLWVGVQPQENLLVPGMEYFPDIKPFDRYGHMLQRHFVAAIPPVVA
jgi:hypothetical protein